MHIPPFNNCICVFLDVSLYLSKKINHFGGLVILTPFCYLDKRTNYPDYIKIIQKATYFFFDDALNITLILIYIYSEENIKSSSFRETYRSLL